MIRPRGPRKCPSSATPNRAPQDFIYTPDELSVMASSIGEFASSGLLSPRHGDGFVFGILKQDSVTGRLELDLERNRELVALATTSGREEGFRFKCVLHRAVDDLLTSAGTGAEVRKVMEEVKRCGFDGLLTSGGRGGAVNNVRRLKMVVDVAEEDGVEVIVGGGVRSGNLGGLAGGLSKDDGLWEGVWFHSSCLRHEGMFDEQEAEGLAEQIRNMKCCLP
ncbi:hypothetical protein N657DRAFT_210135 [Parathielavia appendiculata]|uniref:Copper homeostasis protein cutC homolog n=1 Tax=Parathielavia appendiculata TaxID=2587402 RepID=A0AAN6U6M6_9PEZI|nr:hypothetical protein N657DRAFT_210135 [Parathielavia appendiculata]